MAHNVGEGYPAGAPGMAGQVSPGMGARCTHVRPGILTVPRLGCDAGGVQAPGEVPNVSVYFTLVGTVLSFMSTFLAHSFRRSPPSPPFPSRAQHARNPQPACRAAVVSRVISATGCSLAPWTLHYQQPRSLKPLLLFFSAGGRQTYACGAAAHKAPRPRSDAVAPESNRHVTVTQRAMHRR